MCVKRDIFGKGRICQLEALAGVCFEKAELAVPRDCCLEIDPGRQNIERIFSMHEFKDRVRHEEYLKLMDELRIPKSVPLIVEVTSKPKGGDYIQCVSKSRDSLARTQRNLCHA